MENPARVSSTFLVSVASDRYSVPRELAGQQVNTRLDPGQVVVVAEDKVMVSHERLSDRGETRYEWQHYLSLVQRKPGIPRNGAPFADWPEPLIALQRALMRRPGGDGVMARLLAAVPTAGLDAVLVAMSLVLETGAVSAEHVLNVLARLSAAPAPEKVEAGLTLSEPPMADAARYDSLSADHSAQEDHHA